MQPQAGKYSNAEKVSTTCVSGWTDTKSPIGRCIPPVGTEYSPPVDSMSHYRDADTDVSMQKLVHGRDRGFVIEPRLSLEKSRHEVSTTHPPGVGVAFALALSLRSLSFFSASRSFIST